MQPLRVCLENRHRRAQLARVTHPRFLRTAEWVTEATRT
jgi:hypothetical protein